MIVHLSPHQSSLRLAESILLCSLVKTMVDTGEDLVVMGDFNTLSPYDMRLGRSMVMTNIPLR